MVYDPNAKARAAGWSSRGQQYRAAKAGIASPAAYRATIAAAKQTRETARLTKAVAKGQLIGAKATSAGRVIAANVTLPGQAGALARELRRIGDSRHVAIHVQTTAGEQANLGSRGGWRMSTVKGAIAANGGLMPFLIAELGKLYTRFTGSVEIVTVTVA